MLKIKAKIIATALVSLCAVNTIQAGEVEVLHYWTSGSEAKSVAELKRLLEEKGHSWKDFAVSGGAGDAAMTVLKSRAVSGNPPAAAQVLGAAIQEWGAQGVLADMSSVAQAGDWDNLLPEVIAEIVKYEGKYVAAPFNVHRVNWVWANPAVFEQAGLSVPTNWEDFFVVADKLKAAGITPIAHGGQPWQDFTLFETIVLGVGGADLYNKVFVALDTNAMTSAAMVKSFEIFKRLKDYMDPGAPGRDWNVATGMVIEGKAAMQFMGDWAKGEFTAAGKKPGEDYLCLAAPGTNGSFTFVVDSFVLFNQKNQSSKTAQAVLASTIMEPEFQEIFNLNKGSIPVRLNMNNNKFDSCATNSMDQFVSSALIGELKPSVAHGMAVHVSVKGAMEDVVTKFFNTSGGSPSLAAKSFAHEVRAAKAELL